MTPLLAQVRRGERAFERFYRRHVADVYRYALVVLRNPDDAEDVTQTTFLNAYRAFGRGEQPRNTRAWVLALAHGVCRQRARTAADEPIDRDLDPDLAEPMEPDEAAPSPSEIRRALTHLPFTQRAALVMRELEGRPYAEIGQVLEHSPAEVETLVFEGRRALREQLERAMTCHEAERAISRQIDGRLSRSERRPLRRHLRQCDECAGFARSQRALRPAWKTLARVQLPVSLQSFFGSGGVVDRTAGRGAGLAAVGALAKAVAIAVIGTGAVGLAYESLGAESSSTTAPAVTKRTAESAETRLSARPTAALARSRATPSMAEAKRAASPRTASAAAVAARPAHSQPAPSPAAVKAVPARSKAFQVRARAKPKPVGHTPRVASQPANEPTTQPARAEPVNGRETVAPPAAPPQPPVEVPQLPTIPPFPTSLPPPPQLPPPPKLP